MRVKVLVLPVYKRHWMFHAWLEGELASGPGGFKEGEAWWRHGSTVQDKVQALTFQVNQSVSGVESLTAHAWCYECGRMVLAHLHSLR
jgi:hypothetical protein